MGGRQSRAAVRGDTVSEAAIQQIVSDFMHDNAINNPLLPDFMERVIYQNVIRLMLCLLGRVLSGANISLLGHRIRMHLEPSGSAGGAATNV
jgi:hypothetical protein